MRLATWNVWWRFGDWSARKIVIERVLRQLNADIIGLQEVWFTESENLGESLAAKLGYHCAFAPSPAPGKWQRRISDDTTGIGNAILSRWPITSTSTTRLPAGDAPDEGRVALHAMVESPLGSVPFTTTQLNSAWGQSHIRTEQLRETARLVAAQPNATFPPILCGDFNAMYDFDEIRALAGKTEMLVPDLVLLDAWEFIKPGEAGFIWDRRNPHVDATYEPSARIDYMFVGLATGTGLGKPTDAGLFGDQPIDGVWPSEHFGVWAEVLADK